MLRKFVALVLLVGFVGVISGCHAEGKAGDGEVKAKVKTHD